MIPHDNLRWTYGQRNMIVWLKLFNHQGLVRTRVNVTNDYGHSWTPDMRTVSTLNRFKPGQISRTNHDKIKNVEFKTIIHCQSRNKEGNSISQICFNLQVELRSTSRSNVTVLAIRNPRTAWSGDRPVRIGPIISKFWWSWTGPRFGNFCWSWSSPVPGFEFFLGSGPIRSQVKIVSF